MSATAVTLNDLEGHSQVAGLFKCNPSNICAAFYTISTDSVLARFLCIRELLVTLVRLRCEIKMYDQNCQTISGTRWAAVDGYVSACCELDL